MLPPDDEGPPLPEEPPPAWTATPCYSVQQHVARLKAGEIAGYESFAARCERLFRHRLEKCREQPMIKHRAAIPPDTRLRIVEAIANFVNPRTAFAAAGVSPQVLVTVYANAERAGEDDEDDILFRDAIEQALAESREKATSTVAKAVVGYDEVTRTRTSRQIHKKTRNDAGETVYALLPDPEVTETETSTHKFDPDLALKTLERLDKDYWGPGFLKYLDRLTPEERIRVALGELADLGVLSPSPALSAGSAAEGGDPGDSVCEAEWERCSPDD